MVSALQKTLESLETQSPMGLFSNIAEIRECRAAEANGLLKQGWVLLGFFHMTMAAEINPQPKDAPKPLQDKVQARYVRKTVAYVVGRPNVDA